MLEAPEDDPAAGYDHDMEYQLEEIFVQEQGDEARGPESLMSATDNREDARHRDRREDQSLPVLNMTPYRRANLKPTIGLEATTATVTPPAINSTVMNCIYRCHGWSPQRNGFHSIFCCVS